MDVLAENLSPTRPPAPARKPARGGRGIALIATLMILALVSVSLVLYVSIVSSDRQSTHNYSQGLRAEQLAQSGLAQIVTQLQSEIADRAKSAVFTTASSTVYRPLAATNAVPERMRNLTGIPGIDAVVKISKPGAPIFTSASIASTNYASSILTTAKSLNGRNVSLARWNKPALIPVDFTNNLPVPAWVLVGHGGPFVPAAGSDLGGSGAALGRYAYVVYDVSGLLDANVAGYPPQGAAAMNKGLLPWVDLTSLPSAPDMAALMKWRNAKTAATWANYATHVTNAAANGFLQVEKGDTAFLNRQELISYFTSNGWGKALPYLTTFSRELNGPVWGPLKDSGGAPFDYASHQYKPTTTPATVTVSGGLTSSPQTISDNNVFILNPRIKNAYQDTRDLPRTVGEPLVKYRFPLSKLALLEKQGTTGLSSDGKDLADIKKYFGLVPAPDSNGLYRHWVYTNPSGASSTTGATKILTLDDVAALNPGRDPDFFELLQAGVLSGSLGKPGRADTAVAADPDVKAAYQLIRIGANLIDQWDADSYPTTLTFDGSDFYGIEDLPYISKTLIKVTTSTPQTTYVSPSIPVALYFELWNPHLDQGNSTGANRPAQLRLVPAPGAAYGYSAASNLPGPPASSKQWATLSPQVLFSGPNGGTSFTGGIMTISSYAASDYREPSLISGSKGSPTIPLTEISPSIVGIELQPFNLPVAPAKATDNATTWPPPVPPPPASPPPWYCMLSSASTFNYLIQFLGPDGAYHTYGNWIGVNSATTAAAGMFMSPWISPVLPANTSANSVGWAKSDPRTSRFGIPYFNVGATATAGTSLKAGPGATPAPLQLYTWYPFSSSASATVPVLTPLRIDMWAVNANGVAISGPSSTSATPAVSPFYNDIDGTQRPGDAVDAYAQSHYPFYQNVAQTAPLPTGESALGYVPEPTRPVVLNRPFQSVGDIGYAFRDMPWKSLDLFSDASPDSGLLDLFTLSDTKVVAGRVNPNTAPAEVLTALLNGAALSWNSTTTNTLSASASSSVATPLHAYVAATPFLSRADLVPLFMSNAAVKGISGNRIKGEREAVVRALAESANTRTWNFLIDIIAQSGRYPQGTTATDNFVVEGQRRYWLHIAIDRYTDEIVDQQLEIVNE